MPSVPVKFVDNIARPNVCCLSIFTSFLGLSVLKTQVDFIPENRSHIPPLIESYCFSLHGDNESKGDFRLEEVLRNGWVAKNAKMWQKVIEILEYEEMPPVEEDQSDRRACRLYLSTIEQRRVGVLVFGNVNKRLIYL